MNFNPEVVPFSRRGSYLAFTRNGQDKELYLTTMHGGWEDPMKLFRIKLLKDFQTISYCMEAKPWELLMKTKFGKVQITMNEKNGVLIKGSGIGLEISFEGDHFKTVFSSSDVAPGMLYQEFSEGETRSAGYNPNLKVNFWENKLKTSLNCLKGSMYENNSGQKIIVTPSGGEFELYIAASVFDTESLEIEKGLNSFDAQWIQKEYENWVSDFHLPSDNYVKTARLAQYILWSSTVGPCGNISRNAVLMSKNWMHRVWSWDHCFNALALVKNHNELAWDQMLVIFDKQYENGMLIDSIYPLGSSTRSTKPPIHGWCFDKLLKAGLKISNDEMKKFYKQLSDWTNWWFRERDDDKDDICQYNYNNESGYDNSTIFDQGLPVESPDLTAYLILQLKCLSELAEKLGEIEDVKKWGDKAQLLLTKLVEHFWRKEEFVSVHVPTQKDFKSMSLANLMPLVLGNLLPKEYFKRLVEILSVEYDYLTPYGLATEAMSSEFYDKLSKDWHGGTTYWRGPIWAPLTYLIIDGLRRGGEDILAKKIAIRFCNTINEKEGIFENYDATTGAGKCDPSYTWTCSVFLLLLEEFGL